MITLLLVRIHKLFSDPDHLQNDSKIIDIFRKEVYHYVFLTMIL